MEPIIHIVNYPSLITQITPNEHILKLWKERMDKWADIKLRKTLGGNITIHKPINNKIL
jgi:hypothetical protein